jgi:hypothetical protein
VVMNEEVSSEVGFKGGNGELDAASASAPPGEEAADG